MKNFIKILLFSLFSLFVFSGVTFAASFPDVSEDHDNYTAIEFLKERGIINGYADGSFGPDNFVNRAEATKVLVEGFGIAAEKSANSFTDVKSSDWFYEYVLRGKNAGLIAGYSDGTFKPANNINMAEVMKILLLAAGKDGFENPQDAVFVDVEAGAWYAPYAYYAREKNLVLAGDDGRIGIASDMNRAEFAEIIYRMIIVKESQEKPYPLATNWTLYSGISIPFKIKYPNDNWKIMTNNSEVIFFKPDNNLGQFSPTRTFPNSAKLIVSVDHNDGNFSVTSYFANLRKAFAGAEFTEFNLGEYKALEVLSSNVRQVDWYVYLDTGQVLAVYTEYGDGTLGFQFPKVIAAMLSTLEYKYVDPSIGNKEGVMSEVFENLLIENMGTKILSKITDKIIIDTDTIGVGTGPVDYYFSESFDYTLKYERFSDLILDAREGRTTAF